MEGLESQAKEFKIFLGSSRNHWRFLSMLTMKSSWSFWKIALVMAHWVTHRGERQELCASPVPWLLLSVVTLTTLRFCTADALAVTAEPWPRNSRSVHIMQSRTRTARHWWQESLKRTHWLLPSVLAVPASTELSGQYLCMSLVSFLSRYSAPSLPEPTTITKLYHVSY